MFLLHSEKSLPPWFEPISSEELVSIAKPHIVPENKCRGIYRLYNLYETNIVAPAGPDFSLYRHAWAALVTNSAFNDYSSNFNPNGSISILF